MEPLLARTSRFRLDVAHHGPPGERQFRFLATYSFRSLADLQIRFSPA